ncbi:family S53 protease [Linnemannia elongata]|nr:family S53 protease [Linnemannia elongata]
MTRLAFTLILLALLAGIALAAPQPIPPLPPSTPAPTDVPGVPDFTKFVPGPKLDSIPPNYVDLGVAPGSTNVSVTIGLKLSNFDNFLAQLSDISDFQSLNYGKHLSAEALAVLEPPKQQIDLALTWLKTFSIDATYSRGYLTFNVTVDVMKKLFQTEYHVYRSAITNQEIIRTLSYNVVSVLADLFEVVLPGIDFDDIDHHPKTSPAPGLQALRKRQAPPSCNSQVTPACLQALYGIPKDPARQPQNTLSVPGFLNEYANSQDLNFFLSNTRPNLIPRPSFSTKFIDGGKNPQEPNTAGVEANLDTQYTVGLVNGGHVEFYSSALNSLQGFINMANSWLAMTSPPSVVSISYGFDEKQVSPETARNLCNQFAQLGARGVSVIVASGDGGVGGGRPKDTCPQFVPTFPASCPYVTAVGATVGMTEAGADLSSGGFSNYFTRPYYQHTAVTGYLGHLGSMYQGRYNANGRAFPDVAAQGVNIAIAHNGQAISVDGTSASAPIFASVVALINDRLLAKGRKPLGFLNPFIYQKQGIFNDITTGSNPSCGTTGFPATQGYDCVTGLGTPNFGRFAAAVGV